MWSAQPTEQKGNYCNVVDKQVTICFSILPSQLHTVSSQKRDVVCHADHGAWTAFVNPLLKGEKLIKTAEAMYEVCFEEVIAKYG